MNIYITLDYELFFGTKSGSVDNCIIEPTKALLKIAEPYNIKFVFFVDVGYLVKLEEHKEQFPELQKDYLKVTHQIKHLAEKGHGIELHIHPHWEDSYYDGNDWIFNVSRYKFADFSLDEIKKIVSLYTSTLTRISGKAPKAYRAGGWSAQPFNNIGKALKANDIYIDSTVFPGGYYESANQCYDFRNVQQYNTCYHFSEDLTIMQPEGYFKEIPISSYKLSPIFFWKFVYHKLRKQNKHQAFGDGQAISKTKKDTIKLLSKPSVSVVSIDGYKSSYLEKAYNAYRKNTDDKGNFVIIGHPKAITPYSLERFSDFLKSTNREPHFKIFK